MVGGDTLLAKEIREVLGETQARAARATDFGVSRRDRGNWPRKTTKPWSWLRLNAESLEGARVAFLAGSPASSRRALKLNPDGRTDA